jgi:CheY-like chemotaxis protein
MTLPARHGATSAHQVLIVEDSDDIRDALALALRFEGCEVAAASGVEDAYRQMADGFRPCIVLLDMHMPRLNGWDFLERRRQQPGLSHVPVIVVSGDDEMRNLVEQIGCGFLLKPVRNDILCSAISRRCPA